MVNIGPKIAKKIEKNRVFLISGHIPGENMQNLGLGGTKQPIFTMIKFELEVEREMYPPLRLHKGYKG